MGPIAINLLETLLKARQNIIILLKFQSSFSKAVANMGLKGNDTTGNAALFEWRWEVHVRKKNPKQAHVIPKITIILQKSITTKHSVCDINDAINIKRVFKL